MHFVCAVLCALLRASVTAHSADIHPLLEKHGSTSSALRIRLLPPAIRYLNGVGAYILAKQLPRILIPNINHRLANDQGFISLSRVRVSRFRRASTHNISTSGPNKLTWVMRNLNIGMIGDLSGEVNIVVPLMLEGQVEVLAEGVDFRLESALERSPSGSARVVTISCRTSIKALFIDNHNGGLAGIALNLFKMAISEHIRPLIQTLICKKVTRFIDEDLNEKLARTQTKSSLALATQQNSIGRHLGLPDARHILTRFKGFTLNASNPFGEQIATRVFIDYRLTEEPICYANTVELANLGHISIGNNENDETPFGVPPLRWPKNRANDAMAEVLLSDYLPNALLYHAFKERLLKFVIDEETTSSLSGFLRTSCTSESICFADVLPQLGERFPNNKVQLVVVATRSPTVIFASRNGGVISMNVNGLIFIYVFNENGVRRQAAVFGLDLVADTSLQVQNSMILGKVTLSRFHLSKTSGNIGITDEEVSDLALLSSEMLQKFVNNVLQNGFPIPIPQVVHLTASDLRILDRCALLSTHFTLDQRRVSDIASLTIFNSTPFGHQ